jgi:hypothetical protein
MPVIWVDLLTIFLFLIPFLLIHIFFSTRKRFFWGLVVPVLWTAFGVWMTISNYKHESIYIMELIFFYLIGDIIFIGLLLIIRYMKKKRMDT